MGERRDGSTLAEVLAVVFVLADIPVIALALVVGPVYAVALAAVVVVGTVLGWYLKRRLDAQEQTGATGDAPTDPVTELQRRYAAGELTESEFEAKLDRLVESNERAERAGVETEDLSLDAE